MAYAKEDFEWDQLQRISIKDLSDGNVKIMRAQLSNSLQASATSTTTESSAPDSKP